MSSIMCRRACLVFVLVSNGFPKQLVERANNKNSITSFSKALGTAIFLGSLRSFFKARAVQNAREQTSTASGTACTSIPRYPWVIPEARTAL